jgi:hypothetical protein
VVPPAFIKDANPNWIAFNDLIFAITGEPGSLTDMTAKPAPHLQEQLPFILSICRGFWGDGGDFTALSTALQQPAALCWHPQLLVSVQFLCLDLFDEIIPEENDVSRKIRRLVWPLPLISLWFCFQGLLKTFI